MHLRGERAHVLLPALRVCARTQRAGRAEILPEHAQRIEPRAAIPVFLRLATLLICGQAQRAKGGFLFAERCRRKPQHGVTILRPHAIHRIRQRILQAEGDGIVQIFRRVVRHLHGEKRRRNAGILLIRGNEGIERAHRRPARKALIGQFHARIRVAALKRALGKVRRARQRAALRPKAIAGKIPQVRRTLIWRGQIALQHARVEHFPAALRLDGQERKAVVRALVGPVPDFPVDQHAVARQANAARANAAQREGNGLCVSALIPHNEPPFCYKMVALIIP